MKLKFIFWLLLCLSYTSFGQISYRTRYQRAVLIETFASSPIFSVNIENAVNRRMKSFTTLRYGVGFVPGSKKSTGFGWVNNGISLPVGVTQNFNVNNLQRRVKMRVSMRCKSTPSKIALEWFGEVGASYTPIFYGISAPKHVATGIIGLRQQVIFDIPPKPKVIFVKIQYTPNYSHGSLSWNPFDILSSNSGGLSVFGASLGFSF